MMAFRGLPPSPSLPRWQRRLQDLLLLPLALLFIVFEDILWRGAKMLLAGISALPAVGSLRGWLGLLPGYAALPLFLVPELGGRVGELWVAVLLYHKRVVAAVLVYALVRLIATLVAVFIWQACAPALLKLRWFARMVGWVEAARDWALARTAYLRTMARLAGFRAEGQLAQRFRMLRRLILRWGRRQAPPSS